MAYINFTIPCHPLVQRPGGGGRAVHPEALLGNAACSREWAQKSSFGIYQLEHLLEEGRPMEILINTSLAPDLLASFCAGVSPFSEMTENMPI